ncbi:MAG: 16S rRNA (guanine(966)-N(2))-methyltransferase RsmD [Chromatiales bacterium]|nr:16S rRNA (guanine(966)-N(2))-methyltransferase RsmD [Chromatiales bacterium]
MSQPRAPASSVRIVGGRFRSRRVPFEPGPGLRPTPDRVRETLFNWLVPVVTGARCVDLYAGTGALGIEAVSRGASSSLLIESDRRRAGALTATCAQFDVDRLRVVHADALAWLDAAAPGSIDIAFVDPPFADRLHARTVERLASTCVLAPGAHVYIEYPLTGPAPDCPAGWRRHRSQHAGDVAYDLWITPPGDPA